MKIGQHHKAAAVKTRRQRCERRFKPGDLQCGVVPADEQCRQGRQNKKRPKGAALSWMVCHSQSPLRENDFKAALRDTAVVWRTAGLPQQGRTRLLRHVPWNQRPHNVQRRRQSAAVLYHLRSDKTAVPRLLYHRRLFYGERKNTQRNDSIRSKIALSGQIRPEGGQPERDTQDKRSAFVKITINCSCNSE